MLSRKFFLPIFIICFLVVLKLEYAVAQGIDHESALAWWVLHALQKKKQIMVAVNNKKKK